MRNLYASILAIAFLSACQREFSSDVYDATRGVSNSSIVKSEPIKANLQGNIYDENGQPAENVLIKVGSKNISTDVNGYFRIADASLDKNASLVSAEKAGYLPAYRSFCANTGTNQVVIRLFKKISAGTINAVSGGEVSLSNGSKISLPVNGVVTAATGKAYTGDVTVYAAYIDPSSQEIVESVPGSFIADDKDGNRVVLASFGMLSVELESASGEKLQIAAGTAATLTTAIPSSLQAAAPATIPLWYSDQQTGIWKEEGNATKMGNNYVGQVKHFSTWNCDLPNSAVIVSLTLKNAEGQTLPNACVKVQSKGTSPISGYAWTDSLGRFSEYVPVNQSLDLFVVNPCHETEYIKSVGPFTGNSDIGDVLVRGLLSVVTVTGQLSGCAETPSKTYAVISLDNMIHYAAADAHGNFSTRFTYCAGAKNILKVFGIDASILQKGEVVTLQATAPVTNAGIINTCNGGSVEEYIIYSYDSVTTHVILDTLTAYPHYFQGQSGSNTSMIIGHTPNTATQFILSFTNEEKPGTFPLSRISIGDPVRNGFVNASITITNFPLKKGEFYEGSFSSEIHSGIGASGTIYKLKGRFKVKRKMY